MNDENSWICDDGGLHWNGDPCDCPPDEDEEVDEA
jgi:hypothetical protein